ncbi:putative reverse transcriptase domain-containing protein [Tanacetum coccineum]
MEMEHPMKKCRRSCAHHSWLYIQGILELPTLQLQRNRGSCSIGKMVQEDGIYVPHQQLCHQLSSEVRCIRSAGYLANSLMDQKVCATAARQAGNNRRWESTQGNKHVQQPPPKRQNVARAYIARPGEKKTYAWNLPYYNKHFGKTNVITAEKISALNLLLPGASLQLHGGRDTLIFLIGHMTRDCRTLVLTTTQRATVANQKAGVTCYECGKQGYYQSAYSKLKNQNRGNQIGNKEARGKAYALGGGEGCTLNFLNHPFNIDLMPVELGSFDVIIGMDLLMKYHVMIVCDEKIVHIPYGMKSSRFKVIEVMVEKMEKKSEEKRLEDVPIVRDFPEVFSKDF